MYCEGMKNTKPLPKVPFKIFSAEMEMIPHFTNSSMHSVSHLKVQCVAGCLTFEGTMCDHEWAVSHILKVQYSVCMDVSEIIYAIHSEYFVFADWSEIQELGL